MYVKVSVPENPAVGVYTTAADVPLMTVIGAREPLAGWETIEKVRGSPSGSEPVREISTEAPSDAMALASVAVGWVLSVVAAVSVDTQDSLPSESYADTAV